MKASTMRFDASVLTDAMERRNVTAFRVPTSAAYTPEVLREHWEQWPKILEVEREPLSLMPDFYKMPELIWRQVSANHHTDLRPTWEVPVKEILSDVRRR